MGALAARRGAGTEGVAAAVTGAERSRKADHVIRTERLSKRYAGDRGILELDLEVERGEVFGFLGPNGAGKTTTIRLLLDMVRATSGSATVFGLDSHRDTLQIRRRCGYVPGELSLYPKLTGGQTLRYFAGLRGGVDGRGAGAAGLAGVEWAYVLELAERLDCDLSRRNADLSSGNKRKLALIQAFMHRPELLILDEPTSGLDPLVQHEFYRMVREAREGGQSVFLSSHVLPEVQRICDRVAFIREARLVEVEDVAALVGRAVREVEVVFGGEPASGDVAVGEVARRLAALPGVSAVVANGAGLRLTVAGPMDALVKELAAHEVVSLTSREPDLDDVFMTFYGERGGSHAGERHGGHGGGDAA